ncbi:hypothetical protein CRE_16351 [Caenorhabditis remanei]|uniref:SCP domain-containing protein n=1 Tax=Caenorhabditis remanei TaxID=31234 RepID=E3NC81_CAERE|nr:hypothetical protein CRE_16351 [Caenorhabditis remanei]
MKAILTVTLVLFGVRFGQTDFIKNCLTEGESIKDIIAAMNEIRASHAEDYQIANMHELKYDMALEKEARKMKSCDDLKHGVNYRVAFYGEGKSDAVWKEFVKNSARTDSYSEADHPLLTFMIKCDLTTECDERNFIVLFGPRGTLSLSDFQRGPPGSKCTHGKTEEGLCIAPPKTELETTAPPTSKIETTAPPKFKIETTAPSRSDSEAIGSSSENNGEGVNSSFVYLSIAFLASVTPTSSNIVSPKKSLISTEQTIRYPRSNLSTRFEAILQVFVKLQTCMMRFPSPSYYNKFLIQKYDMSLEKEARKMKSCDDIKHGVNYRLAFYGERESRAIWQEFSKSTEFPSFYFHEEEHPLQTSVIQCVLTTTCHLNASRSGNSFNTEMATITLYGWRGTFSLSDYQRGESGSKCTHGKTERGLCIASSSENNGESVGMNSIFVYLFIAFMYLFL